VSATEVDYTRYQFLHENPAVTRQSWLPPKDEVPELADLRETHTRLLDASAKAQTEAMALTNRREVEEEARRAAEEAKFLNGKRGKTNLPDITVTDDEIVDAQMRAMAARDALQTFVRSAVNEIQQDLAPLLRKGFEEVDAEEDRKRAEAAAALLREADRLKLSTKRLDQWLARADGRSHLGLIAWGDLAVPIPVPVPTLEEMATPQSGEVEEPIEDISNMPTHVNPQDTPPWEVRLTRV
jgi:hypothetical protein